MISAQYILSTGSFHLDSRLPPWWFPLGDFTLVISPWWFGDQLTSLNTLWRILLVPPKLSYFHGNFHFMPPASCIWLFNYKKFKYHGPLVHWWISFDRCVGSFSEGEEDCTVLQCCWLLLHLGHHTRCSTTPFGAAFPLTRIQNSRSLKSLVKEGVTCYICRMSYYCKSTTSSTPYYFL